ncbi:MAG: C-terminal binding protein [Lachnobacterium sp.]|nr:C-terminal binding protein [Lachnobacterium sp.]
MKIIISDFPEALQRNVKYEEAYIKKMLPQAEVSVIEYHNKDLWLQQVRDADALLTAFLKVGAEVMDAMPKLKCIVLNASGYDNIDTCAASERNIAVIPIQEYCTQEVAEHTMALLLALERGLKQYTYTVDIEKRWQYHLTDKLRRIEGQTLGIVGFGKIGKAVARRAQAFGMKVLVCSSHANKEEEEHYQIRFVTKEELFAKSDVISNHMAMNKDNQKFFDQQAFEQMKKRPVFINVARGRAVDEKALEKALEEGVIRGAGLDVLESEEPKLAACKLTNRNNVIITPHAAFYSEDSIKALQEISCQNLCYFLQGEKQKVHWIVNEDSLR